MNSVLRFILVCALVLAAPQFIFAYAEQTSGGTVFSNVSPSAPSPREQVTIELDLSPSFLRGAAIEWRENGSLVSRGIEQSTYTFNVGNAGVQTDIEAFIQPRGQREIVKTFQINPGRVDILVDAHTTTPRWYRGAPQISPESIVHLSAIPEARTTKGKALETKDFIYTWRDGTTVLLSGYGKSSLEITGPLFGISQTISVLITDSTNIITAYNDLTIESTQPQIFYYEVDPLIGTITNRASGFDFVKTDEITLKAEPYSFSVNEPLTYAWSIKDTPVEPKASNPQLLTIRRGAENYSEAIVSTIIENMVSLLQRAESFLTLQFESKS
ncbi:MAG: hypothetical protein Q8Q18_02185 [bacterium]|nr:hypothetical protein [bacterium]